MQRKRYPGQDDRFFDQLELPAKLKTDLTAEADSAWKARIAQEEADAEAKAAEDEEISAAIETKKKVPALPSIDSPSLAGEGPRITLIEPELINRVATRLATVGLGDKQRKENLEKTIKLVAARGSQRVVHRRVDWEQALDELRNAHANFAPVIDVIAAECALAAEGQPIRLSPLLLNGPPGCGKTFFAEALAKFFQTGFERFSMETAQNQSELTGISSYWSNTAPGRLFNRLIEGDYANPVILLDEIDKAGGSEAHRSDKALYALLERESARHWSDASLPDLLLDTSHVVWLLTSNDARNIPAPLRSRMQQFDIKPLGSLEARRLVATLYAKEVEKYPHLGLSPNLPIAHCDVLRLYSPRVMVRFVHDLVARLALHQRTEVALDDLEAVGALGDLLVAFDRHFDGLIEWKVQ